MIETDAIETIFKRQDTLDLIRLNGSVKDIANCPLAIGLPWVVWIAIKVIGQGEDGSEIIGRVPPLRSQPCVVEIKPPNHAADVEGCFDRLQLPIGARHSGTTRQCRTGNDRSKQLGTSGILKR